MLGIMPASREQPCGNSPLASFVLAVVHVLALFVVVPAASQELDLDGLLDQAQTIESPLAEPEYCKVTPAWAATGSGENSGLRIRVDRICLVDDIVGIESATNMLVVEGEVTNLSASPGYSMLKASLMFQLGLNHPSSQRQGISDVEERLNPEFEKPLLLFESRRFVVAYDVDPEFGGPLSLEHPSTAGIISIALGNMPRLATSGPGETTIEEPRENTPTEATPPAPIQPARPDSPSMGDDVAGSAAPETTPVARGQTSEKSEDGPDVASETMAGVGEPASRSRAQTAIVSVSEFTAPIVNDPPASLGPPISASGLGGRIMLSGGVAEDSIQLLNNGLQGEKLHDGVVQLAGERVSKLYGTESEPVEVVFSFSDGAAAEIAGLAVNTFISNGGNQHLPQTLELDVSAEGPNGPWNSVVVRPELPKDQKILLLELEEPVLAKAVRIRLRGKTPAAGGKYSVALSEIEVFERPKSEDYKTIVGQVAIDLAARQNGGRVVRFSSQDFGDANHISSILEPNDVGGWRPNPASDDVPEVVLAFRDFARFKINGVELDWERRPGLPENWSPKVRVSASTNRNPLAPYEDVGSMVFERDRFVSSIALRPDLQPRYVKLTFAGPEPNTFGVETVKVFGDYAEWFAGGQDGNSAETRISINSGGPIGEVEDNNTQASANPLRDGVPLGGRSDGQGDIDYFSFVVDGAAEKIVNFRLSGTPAIRTDLELLGADGSRLFDYRANGGESSKSFTWKLPPGRYHVRLSEPASNIVLVIDDSGSMGESIFTAMEAAKLFALNKRPDEKIALVRFSGSIKLLSELTGDGQKIADAIDAGVNQGDTRGTSLYDAILKGRDALKDTRGNRAIVLMTDGADVSSKTPYIDFWRQLDNFDTPVFAIGLGKAMAEFNGSVGIASGDMIASFSHATGGEYFAAPQADQLEQMYGRIASIVRRPSEYEIEFSIADETGQLQVLETGEKVISANQLGEILIILDASGSMKSGTDAGRSRINVARTVLFDILHELPDEIPVGLGVYGHRQPDNPKDRSCRDYETIVTPQPFSKDTIIEVVRAVEPRGQTPIGLALAEASESIARHDRSLIIVLTDGKE